MDRANLPRASIAGAVYLCAFLFSAAQAPAQTPLYDDFTQDSSLKTTLWSLNTPLLSTLAADSSSPGSALVAPTVAFGSSGMTLSGVNGTDQFTGIQSSNSLAPPFRVTATVMGASSHGDAFALYLVNADLSQWLQLRGDLDPSSCSQGIWLNYSGGGAAIAGSGVNLYATPSTSTVYTIQLAVGSDGSALVLFEDSGASGLAARSGISLGQGPFHLVLAQQEALPCAAGANAAVWQAVQALSGGNWQPVWRDEFNGSAGSPPSASNWNYDLGAGGWGNGELETYTNSTANSFQDGAGNLDIRAIRDGNGNFTSARLQTGAPTASTRTTDLSWQYGLVEARIKLPFGLGVWPAFWMLGEDFALAGWPACGEIDIMENFGTFANNASVNNGTAHGPGYSGGNGITAAYALPGGQTVYGDYHVYSLAWSPNSLQWFVDGVLFHTVTPGSVPPGDEWVFNAPFFILLNLAIGGPSTFLGTPNSSQPFPNQDMLVDYVRVYENNAYLAGDAAPSALDTVPNFGDGLLDVRDLVAELFAVNSIPGFRPTACSDRFDAMDLYPADTTTTRGGDGILDIRDLILELFRVNGLDASRPIRSSMGGVCAGGSAGSLSSSTDAARRPVASSRLNAAAEAALTLGQPEAIDPGRERVAVYLEAHADLSRIALTFGVGDGKTELSFTPAPEAPPSLVQDSQTGVVAAAWLGGITLASSQRMQLGYVSGPAGALANLSFYGASASGLDDNRVVLLDAPNPAHAQR
jgi:beta-glucanase (GH16 family)